MGELDPRGAVSEEDRKALYFKCLKLVLSGSLHGLVLAQPPSRTRLQVAANKKFTRTLADKVDTIFVEKQTASRLTWHAVKTACDCQADAWALFFALRNMTMAAGRGVLHVEKPKLFPKSPIPALRNLRLPKLALGEHLRRWGDILWRRDLSFLEIRVQKRRLFPKAPRWSPLQGIEAPALRLVPKTPKWLRKLRKEQEIPVLKPHENLPSSQQTEKRQVKAQAQSH